MTLAQKYLEIVRKTYSYAENVMIKYIMVSTTESNLLKPTGELCVLETCRHGSEGASWKSVLSLERITRWVATLLLGTRGNFGIVLPVMFLATSGFFARW